MKAIVQDVYGPVDVLELRDVPTPVAGPGDVLVRVRAAGVDPGVWHLMTGLPLLLRTMGFGLRRPKVRIRGRDVAGVVEAVGDGVTRFRAGDEVFGTSEGTFAEYACAPEDRFVAKPANVTFEQAAAVPVSALTALQALRDKGRVEPGQQVLVIGAGGGVGTFAVQLAKEYGARVTAVCSTAKAELVRSIGADEVVDYTRQDFAEHGPRYDLVLDAAGNRPLRQLRRALAPGGTLVIIGGEGEGRWLGGTERVLRAVLLAPFVRHKLRALFTVERPEDLRSLREAIESGTVVPVVDRTFPLAEVPEAIRYAQRGQARGKVVVSL
ncbi:NAD(P)-dependent alcohol dehydrogenase [Streptomyces sp. NPDC059175]|uniref:NAD(P)-dependent alcohol dehydrogenase n=1 Tax=unclassified Streptomyces TaxID=2593676 RepID=UPI00369A12EA